MNTTLTEHTTDEIEELRKDYYDEYYPTPRIEKAIFKYLDQDYYAGRDDVFFTIYKNAITITTVPTSMNQLVTQSQVEYYIIG